MSEEKPLPHELWKQAKGDRAEYTRLLLLHGWILKREKGEPEKPLPCGWNPFSRGGRP